MSDEAYGEFEDETVDAYLDHMWDEDKDIPEFKKDLVDYYIPRDRLGELDKTASAKAREESIQKGYYSVTPHPFLHIPINYTPTVKAPVFAKMLYMDVGRWGGNGPSEKETDAAWGRSRDFGLVCGRTALLCSYKKPGNKVLDVKKVSANVAKTAGYKYMLPLLQNLSSTGQLGGVTITKAMACYWADLIPLSYKEIYVFLGDVHAPIMNKRSRTRFGYSNDIPLFGRLDLGKLKEIGTQHGATDWVLSKIAPGTTLLNAMAAVLRAYSDNCVEEWPSNEKMTESEAEEWFDKYHGATTQKKGADIFEEAGKDLKKWIGLLIEYQNEKTPDKKPLRFVQTGDLFDFWIGLQTCVEWGQDIHQLFSDQAAKGFMTFWEHETLNVDDNSQAQAIYRMLNMDKEIIAGKKKIQPVFLYGNHDNYLGSKGLGSRHKAKLEKVTGLEAEHGHATDTFNHDEDPSKGWAITQLAYLLPDIRKIESKASWLVSQAPGEIGPRLEAIQHALNRCVFDRTKAGEKAHLMYVMGHTHEPMLKEIRIRIRD